MSDMSDAKRKHILAVQQALALLDAEEIGKIVSMLEKARRESATVWIVGNGGSAVTASHFANDLTKMSHVKAIAVGDLFSTVYAYGNDTGWKNMFAGPLQSLMSPSDVLCAISCSGESLNVIEAVHLFGSDFFVLTGNVESSTLVRLARQKATPIIYTHSPSVTVQESLHAVICHAIAEALV